MCHHEFNFSCTRGSHIFLLGDSRGHVSGDFCPRQGRSSHGWPLPTAEKPLSQTTRAKERRPLPLYPPQLTIPAESGIRGPAGIFHTNFFLCKQSRKPPPPRGTHSTPDTARFQDTEEGLIPFQWRATHAEPFPQDTPVCTCGHDGSARPHGPASLSHAHPPRGLP